MQQYIFLDIDGVLNNAAILHGDIKHPENGLNISKHMLELMQRLCCETGAKCILSSNWRFAWDYKKLALILNLPIVGQTAEELQTRGLEVSKYCNNNKINTSDLVIIDDRIDFTTIQKTRLIQTSFRTGFTFKHFNQAKKMLTVSDV